MKDTKLQSKFKTWQIKKLGEIAKMRMGETLIKKDLTNNGIPVYSADSLEKPWGFTSKNRLVFKQGSIVIGARGTIGSLKLPDEENFTSTQTTIIVTPQLNIILPGFLFYFLTILNFKRITAGSGIPMLTIGYLERIKIPLPPLNIQNQIVERLDAIKKAQELNEKQIALADELFQSLLHRELDPRDKNWEVKKLGDIVEFLDHQRIPLNGEERAKRKGPYPYYGATGVLDWVDDYIFDGEYVLLAEDGGPFFEKDKPVAYRVSGKCWVNNHAHVLKPKKSILVNLLGYTLMFMDVTPYLTGSTRAKLNKSQAEKIKVLLPPIEVQRKIVEKLSAVQDYKKKLLDQKQKLQELFESCLNKAMKEKSKK